jgi:hypothetical protein
MKECVTFRSPLEYDDLTFRETEKDNKKLHIAWGNNEMWTAVRPCEDSNKKYFLFVTHFCVLRSGSFAVFTSYGHGNELYISNLGINHRLVNQHLMNEPIADFKHH